jgi:hypothetical protein
MDLLLDAYMQWFHIGSYRLAGHFFSVSKQCAYFSDGGHRFQSDRGQRFAAKADSISS